MSLVVKNEKRKTTKTIELQKHKIGGLNLQNYKHMYKSGGPFLGGLPPVAPSVSRVC